MWRRGTRRTGGSGRPAFWRLPKIRGHDPLSSRYSDDSVSELNLILFGPPGAGKGTQAERLQADFQLPYIATGDILRENVREGTELGRKAEQYMNAGDLVPDDLIIAMVTERFQEEDARDGFILDGFPRTIEQAEALDRQLSELGRRITAVLLLDVPDEEVVRRLSGRRVCVKAGHNYHVEFDPPKRDEVCDQDGSRLIQREDDKPEVIENRLEDLPREDQAGDRLLRGAGAAEADRRHPRPDRGPRSHPRGDRDAPARGKRLSQAVPRVIIKKTPEEIERMAAAGAILVQDHEPAGRQDASGCHHSRTRRGRREVHPLPGSGAGVQGLPRVPGLDLHVAQLDDRPRDPGRLQARPRRPPVGRHGGRPRRVGGRRRAHVRGRPDHADRPQATYDDRGGAAPRRRPGPARQPSW